jgi:hypothetical protein
MEFTVSMLFSVYKLVLGILSDMNSWSFPRGFMNPQMLDLINGWGLCLAWSGWYVKKDYRSITYRLFPYMSNYV